MLQLHNIRIVEENTHTMTSLYQLIFYCRNVYSAEVLL